MIALRVNPNGVNLGSRVAGALGDHNLCRDLLLPISA